MVLQAIKYSRGSLEVLDQLQLPHKIIYDPVRNAEAAWHAIHDMRVRGAPAIAIVAALGFAVELSNNPSPPSDVRSLLTYIHERLDYLVTSRPTAVNLAGAVIMLKGKLDDKIGSDVKELTKTYIQAAEEMLEHDVQDNEAIGKYGSEWILKHSPSQPVSVLTHCNTGSLATAGYGTALGVIRSVHASGALKQAFCTETRPYNQGSRLTAFELVHDKIPATLITDSMAAALLRLRRETDAIAAIVVGADRVAANGDTANKIGTYALALVAKAHGVKFLVAAPRTTIDLKTPSGASIKIEERAALEMTSISGPKVSKTGQLDLEAGAERVSIAAAGINVWNPAFDVTPAELIDGIVTEVGVAEKDSTGKFDLEALMGSR